jgi:hypothetical protein
MSQDDTGFKDLILDPVEQSKIGPAWKLLLLVYYHSDERGFLKWSHRKLTRLLNANVWTVRAWRRSLSDHGIFESVANSRYTFFYLKDPWLRAKQKDIESSPHRATGSVSTQEESI